MRRMGKKMAVWLVLAVSCFVLAGCGGQRDTAPKAQDGDMQNADTQNNTGQEEPVQQAMSMGVSVYNTKDGEVKAFRNYFENYLGPAFDVDFFYSDSINTTDQELDFIDSLHENGVGGLISFLSTDLDTVLGRCDEYGMYYMRGSGTVSEESFKAGKAHSSFLGIIGPDEALEKKAGADMAAFFAGQERDGPVNYLILSGGNQMHAYRAEGMLEQLAEEYSLTYREETSALAATEEIQKVETGSGQVGVTIFPGFFTDTEVVASLGQLFQENDYDVVLGTLAVNDVMEVVEAEEKRDGYHVEVGTVDCFTEENETWFQTEDPFGDTALNYVVGKYGAIVGPSFAAMYNALSGDADFLKVDGEPFRLVQAFWTASDAETYDALYASSLNVYDNTYGTDELMEVIRAFNPDATFLQFKALAERGQEGGESLE